MSAAYHVVCPHCDATNRLPADRPAERGRCGACKAALFEGKPAALDAARLERHLAAGDLPVLVDVWATWCGPCRAMAPAFAAAAGELEPAMRLAKVDIDQAQALAGRLGIRSVPTLVLFHKGREIGRVSGAMDARSIVAWARQHLGRAAA